MEDSNRSSGPDIHAVSRPDRRVWLQGSASVWVAGLLGPLTGRAQTTTAEAGPMVQAPTLLGFQGIPASTADAVVVPPGHVAEVLAPWGDPVGLPGRMPAWRADAGGSAADQAAQLGMHHDGLHYYPLDAASADRHGLLVMNHEYTDDGLLHADGIAGWSAEKVAKAQAAHGVSVIEVMKDSAAEHPGSAAWKVVRPSRHARRITAATPCAVSGPAAGHRLMKTAFDPEGRTVLGTLNNCASGMTPWGTYLAGEENFAFYFAGGERITADQRRWGLQTASFFQWEPHDERFDAARHPNEFHRFGWIVEIDPMDPMSTPVKRTALGRAAHEGATVAVTRDGRAVVYSGEDARFEYITKFVSRDRIRPGGARANRTLLDHGTLYVARFDADGRGVWLPLVHGRGPLTAASGFADQGEVLIKTRQASDLLGATRMDRPEWVAVDARRGEVYCSLTNNSRRGAAGYPAVDAANPRAPNVTGHILRWKEDGDMDGTAFSWTHFVLAGDPSNARPAARGNVQGDAFACPDGLWIDGRGVLWIQTDVSASALNRDGFERFGNNQMLAADPRTGEVRRFLTGPRRAEITGVCTTPDGRTMFVNVQHPGEPDGDRSDPAAPGRHSQWPDGGRPRSATVVVRRLDGGVIGT